MKILAVGATGTVGGSAADALEEKGHEVIRASRSGEHSIDLRDPSSIDALFEKIGTVDAVVSGAGGAPFVDTAEATPEQFEQGFADKLAGQINLVLRGVPHVADGGSFTLVTGILAQEPIPGSVVAGTVNGGLESFVTSAATELPRGLRLNAVSPTVLEESLGKYGKFFAGYLPRRAAEIGQAYVKSVHSRHTGQVYRVW